MKIYEIMAMASDPPPQNPPFPAWVEASPAQVKTFQDAAQVAEEFFVATQTLGTMGWMTWKTSAGRDYLFHGAGRTGHGKSLGVRAQRTEEHYSTFQADKLAMTARRDRLLPEVMRYSKYIKVERLNRLPQMAGKVINLLTKAGLGERLRVVGTNSLYAYEMLAAVLFEPDITATRDLDLLWDGRAGIAFAGDFDDVELRGFSAILRQADKTFTPSMEINRSFSVRNATGYAVDFLMPEPDDGRKAALNDGVRPMGLEGQRMLNDAPVLTQTVFLADGYPCPMRVVDPRYFVLHKHWVAGRDGRDPGKARRDRLQAEAMARVIQQWLPMFGFDDSAFLHALPVQLVPYLPGLATGKLSGELADRSGLRDAGL